jgi:hypothetical protein
MNVASENGNREHDFFMATPFFVQTNPSFVGNPAGRREGALLETPDRLNATAVWSKPGPL